LSRRGLEHDGCPDVHTEPLDVLTGVEAEVDEEVGPAERLVLAQLAVAAHDMPGRGGEDALRGGAVA